MEGFSPALTIELSERTAFIEEMLALWIMYPVCWAVVAANRAESGLTVRRLLDFLPLLTSVGLLTVMYAAHLPPLCATLYSAASVVAYQNRYLGRQDDRLWGLLGMLALASSVYVHSLLVLTRQSWSEALTLNLAWYMTTGLTAVYISARP